MKKKWGCCTKSVDQIYTDLENVFGIFRTNVSWIVVVILLLGSIGFLYFYVASEACFCVKIVWR